MWAPFAQLLLQDSTAYWAAYPWTQGGITYEPRVLQWDRIDRSIPAQAGMAQHSNARIRLADTDRVIRDTMNSYSFRRRTCKIYLAQSGSSSTPILDSEPVFTGEVFATRFGEGWVELTLRDTLFGWMDEEFPALITLDVYPSFPITEPVFAPVLQGTLVAADGQGCVPLPHIGLIGSPPIDRWALACHQIWDLLAVYRQEPGDGVFTLVDPSEYSVVTDVQTVYGIPVTFSFLDFLAPQLDGTLISVDVDGIDARGEWGSLAAVSGSGPLRNPMDYMINMSFFFQAKSGLLDTDEIWDTDAVEFLRDRCEPTGDNTCYADQAILEPITARQWFGQFLTSFEFFIHQQQSTFANPGTITIGILDDSTTGPHFSEIGVIQKGTFEEFVGEPSFNELMVHFRKNYRTFTFEKQTLYINQAEQDILGTIGGSPETLMPKAERDTLEYPCVRDETTAALSVARRLNFLSAGSYRQTFTVDLPGRATVLEPGKTAFITHRMGFQYGGYVQREVKILRVTLDIQRLAAHVETILLEPIITLLTADVIRIFYDISGTGDEQVYRPTITGAIDGSNTTFTIPETPITNTDELFLNGWPQFGLYTISGNTITMDYPPQTGDVLEIFYDIAGTGNEPRYRVTPTGAVDGVNDDFELPETPVTDSERVYIGPILQTKGVDYSMSTPTTVHFLLAVPQTDDIVRVWYDVAGGSRPIRRYKILPRGLINNINTVFTLTETPIANSEQVFVNYVFQVRDSFYTYLDAAAVAALSLTGGGGVDFVAPPQRS